MVKQGILRIENTEAVNNFGEEILFADVINKEFTFDNIKYFVKEITDFDDLTDNPIYLSEKETKMPLYAHADRAIRFFQGQKYYQAFKKGYE